MPARGSPSAPAAAFLPDRCCRFAQTSVVYRSLRKEKSAGAIFHDDRDSRALHYSPGSTSSAGGWPQADTELSKGTEPHEGQLRRPVVDAWHTAVRTWNMVLVPSRDRHTGYRTRPGPARIAGLGSTARPGCAPALSCPGPSTESAALRLGWATVGLHPVSICKLVLYNTVYNTSSNVNHEKYGEIW